MQDTDQCPGRSPALSLRTTRARPRAIDGLALWVAMASFLAAAPVRAEPDTVCDAVAVQAAAETGVPVDVLRTIALIESGTRRNGQIRAWPWAVNEAGKGRWFDSREAALAHVRAGLDAGARNIDIGCFQINHRWHSTGFRSLEDMFDPLTNARYAASFLAGLHAELGDWSVAAGAYHSRTPEFATRYRKRFDTQLARLDPAPPSTGLVAADRKWAPDAGPRLQDVQRPNLYPLLQVGATGSGGSLFPSQALPGLRLLRGPRAALIGEG